MSKGHNGGRRLSLLGLTHIRTHTCVHFRRGGGLSISLSTEEEEQTEASDWARLQPQAGSQENAHTRLKCFLEPSELLHEGDLEKRKAVITMVLGLSEETISSLFLNLVTL